MSQAASGSSGFATATATSSAGFLGRAAIWSRTLLVRCLRTSRPSPPTDCTWRRLVKDESARGTSRADGAHQAEDPKHGQPPLSSHAAVASPPVSVCGRAPVTCLGREKSSAKSTPPQMDAARS